MASSHALAAQAIRTYLKSQQLAHKPKVTSDSFSGGNSVSVQLYDVPPAQFKVIKEMCDRHQYGHFDGMNDIYEYSNSNPDLPQVKYVQVSNSTTLEMKVALYQYIRNTFAHTEDMPAEYDERTAGSLRVQGQYVTQLMWRLFTGADGAFWQHYDAVTAQIVAAQAA